MDEHSARDAASPIARHGAGQRHVVGNHDDLDRYTFGARELGGEAEVQPVAGVVLDHQRRACGTRGSAYGRQHGVDAGRGENITRHSGGKQARPDIARMCGLVTRTAA